MLEKKSQINQIFVYLLSIIIILFVGFLVVKFIGTFSNSVEERVDSKIFSKFESDYSKVFTSYGSEEMFNYKLSSSIGLICFANKANSCRSSIESNLSLSAFENFKIALDSGENIVLFDKNDVFNSKSMPKFNVENDCLCIKPKNSRFSLFFENRKNKVWILDGNTN